MSKARRWWQENSGRAMVRLSMIMFAGVLGVTAWLLLRGPSGVLIDEVDANTPPPQYTIFITRLPNIFYGNVFLTSNGQAGHQTDHDENSTVELEALTSQPYFVFDHWEGDLTGSTNPDSVTMTDDQYVTAVFSANLLPTAQFDASPVLGEDPLSVTFTDTSYPGSIDGTTANDDTITLWEWDFDNDGTIDNNLEQHPTHTYNTPGLYTVALTVTNQHGTSTATYVDLIDVQDVPTVSFSAATSNANEDAGSHAVELSLNFVSAKDAVVEIAVTGGTAEEGTEFVIPTVWAVPAGSQTRTFDVSLFEDSLWEYSETIELTLTAVSDCVLGAQSTHTVTVVEDDALTYTYSSPTSSVTEGSSPAPVQFELSSVAVADVTLGYGLQTSRTARVGPFDAAPNDAWAATNGITIPAGQQTGKFDFGIFDDNVEGESSETFQITLGPSGSNNPAELAAGAVTTHTVTIDENTGVYPAAAFTMSPSSGDAPLAVTFTDTSTPGTYSVTNWEWDFDNDGIVDSTVQNPTHTYTDPGHKLPSLTAGDGTVSGGTWRYMHVDGVPSPDFSESPTVGDFPLSVTFTNSTVDNGHTVTAWAWDFDDDGTTDDTGISPTYSFSAAGTYPVTLTATNLAGSNSITKNVVLSALAAPTASFASIASLRSEVGPTAEVEVVLSHSWPSAINVPYSVSGTAVAGTDYTAPSGTLSIPANTTSATIDISLIDNNADENDREIVLDLTGGTHGIAQHTLVVADDEPTPTIEFKFVGSSLLEEQQYFDVEIELSGPSKLPVQVSYGIGGTTARINFAGAAAPWDYQFATVNPIVVPAEQETVQLRYFIYEDDIPEDDEYFESVLSSPLHATLGEVTIHTVTILDDLDPRTVNFALAESSAPEASPTKPITVTLDHYALGTESISYGVTGGTALNGSEYTFVDGTINFLPGELSRDIFVVLYDDSTDEDDKTVEFGIFSPSANLLLGETLAHELTIEDDDDSPTVYFDPLGQTTFAEGDAFVVIPAKLSSVSQLPVEVSYSLDLQTTTLAWGSNPDPDIGLIEGTRILFEPGEIDQSVAMSIVDDTVAESDETFAITLSGSGILNATLGTPITRTITLQDNGDLPSVGFALDSQDVSENAGTFNIDVDLNVPADGGESVEVYVASSTATGDGVDYTFAAQTVTFAQGADSGSVVLTIEQDDEIEPSEDIVFGLANPQGLTLSSVVSHELTILDDEPTPSVTFENATEPVQEPDGIRSLTVSLSAPSYKTITVQHRLKGGTAADETDFTYTPGTLNFEPGEQTETISFQLLDDDIAEDPEHFTIELYGLDADDVVAGAHPTTKIDITDVGDLPLVNFLDGKTDTFETSGIIEVPLLLSAATAQAASVNVAASAASTAVPGIDYELMTQTVDFPVGANSANVQVKLIEDDHHELKETIVLQFTGGENLIVYGLYTHTIRLEDSNGEPTVFFSDTDVSAIEESKMFQVSLELSHATHSDLGVRLENDGGSAIGGGVDYTFELENQTFPAGTVGPITLTGAITDDFIGEEDETIAFSIRPAGGYELDPNTDQTTVTILDDVDLPVVRFELPTDSANENSGIVNLNVTISEESATPVSVDYAVLSGTALPGTDFTISTGLSGTLHWAALDENDKIIPITLVSDGIPENNEVVVLGLSNASNAVFHGTTSHQLSIVDTDTVLVNFDTAGPVSVDEETVSVHTFDVLLSTAAERVITVPLEVDWALTTAHQEDFELLTTSLTFDPGITTEQVQLSIFNDPVDENTEDVVVKIGSSIIGAEAGATSSYVAVITDSGDSPNVFLNTDDITLDESSGVQDFRIKSSVIAVNPVTVDYVIEGLAETADFRDHTGLSGQLEIPAGASEVSIPLAIVQDAVDEDAEQFRVRLLGANGALLGSPSEFVFTIVDDDQSAYLSLSPYPASVTEGETVDIAVGVAGESERLIEFRVKYVNISALRDVDYSGSSGPFFINPRQESVVIPVLALQNEIAEHSELFSIELLKNSLINSRLGSFRTQAVNINDDEDVPNLAFSSGVSSAPESDRFVSLTVAPSGPSASAYSVDYVVSASGTATIGTDAYLADGTLSFDGSGTPQTVQIELVEDATDEHDETIIVDILAGTGYQLGSNARHTFTIEDSDDPPVVQFAPGLPVTGTEGDAPKTLTATLSAASAKTVTVAYEIPTGGAQSGADFTISPSVLTFPPGDISEDLTLTIENDDLGEEDESITIILTQSGSDAVTIGVGAQHPFTIHDNGDTPELTFTSGQTSANEVDGAANVNVELSTASAAQVAVDWATAAVSATPGADYTESSGTLQIPAGLREGTISIPISADSIDEDWQVFSVTLSNPQGVALPATVTQNVVIFDSDPEPVVKFATASAQSTEGAAPPASVTVELTGQTERTVTVPYRTQGMSASKNIDFSMPNGSVTIVPPATQATFAPASLTGNDGYEATEKFAIALDVPTHASADETASTLVYDIVDDGLNLPVVGFGHDEHHFTELDGTGNIPIVISSPVASDVTVTVGVDSTSTTSVTDYTIVQSSVVILANENSAELQIALSPDSISEPTEELVLKIDSVSANAEAGGFTSTTAYIADNSPLPLITISTTAPAGGVSEGPGVIFDFVVALSEPSENTVTGYIKLGGSAIRNLDYQVDSQWFTIPPQTTQETIRITLIDDPIAEETETIEASTGSIANAVWDSGQGIISVDVADVGDTVSVHFGDGIHVFDDELFVNEEYGVLQIPVHISKSPIADATISFAIADGTTSSSDYANPLDLVFLSGTTELTKYLSIPITDDPDVEGNEDFTITMSATGGASTVEPTSADVWIIDNDDAVLVSIHATTNSVAEGAPALFDVELSRAFDLPVSVELSVTGGTATEDIDFTVPTSTSLLFEPGEIAHEFLVSTINDEHDEFQETFTVSIDSAEPDSVEIDSVNGSAGMAIDDSDTRPLVRFLTDGGWAYEGDGPYEIEVELYKAGASSITVDYVIKKGEADFVAADGQVTIPAGTIFKTFEVEPIADNVPENIEGFRIELQPGVNYVVGSPSRFDLVLVDGTFNDTIPPSTFSVSVSAEGPGTVSGAGAYIYGQNVAAIVPTASEQGIFDHWIDNISGDVIQGDRIFDNNGIYVGREKNLLYGYGPGNIDVTAVFKYYGPDGPTSIPIPLDGRGTPYLRAVRSTSFTQGTFNPFDSFRNPAFDRNYLVANTSWDFGVATNIGCSIWPSNCGGEPPTEAIFAPYPLNAGLTADPADFVRWHGHHSSTDPYDSPTPHFFENYYIGEWYSTPYGGTDNGVRVFINPANGLTSGFFGVRVQAGGETVASLRSGAEYSDESNQIATVELVPSTPGYQTRRWFVDGALGGESQNLTLDIVPPKIVMLDLEYVGLGDGDRDGDGIPDELDNCPDNYDPTNTCDEEWFDLTVTSSEPSLATNGTGSYSDNSVADISVELNSDYGFLRWTMMDGHGPPSGTNVGPGDDFATANTTVDHDKAVRADMAPIHKLALSILGAGQVSQSVSASPSGGDMADHMFNDLYDSWYFEDATVQLDATPANDFLRWEGDLGGENPTDMSIEVTMDEAKSITAVFGPMYTLSATTTGQGTIEQPYTIVSGAMEPNGDFLAGSVVELVALPDSGHRLDSWSGDLVAATPVVRVVMNGNKTLVANFAEGDDRDYEFDPWNKPNHRAEYDDGTGGKDRTSVESGDPITLFSGEFEENDTDLRTSFNGMDVVWSRNYRSQNSEWYLEGAQSSKIGARWDFSFNKWVWHNFTGLAQLKPNELTNMINFRADLYDGAGSRKDAWYFSPSTGTIVSDSVVGRMGFLHQDVPIGDPTQRMVVTYADGSEWTFHAPASHGPGFLESIRDRNGNEITLAYLNNDPTAGLLERVEFAGGTRAFEITREPGTDRIASVSHTEDGVTRSVSYGYTDDDLTTVTQADGTTTTYHYHNDPLDVGLRHLITGIEDGRQNLYVANRYDLNSGDTKGWVLEQAYGEFAQALYDNVTAQTTLPPGYKSYLFEYQSFKEAGQAQITRVKDQDDAIREYEFNNANTNGLTNEITRMTVWKDRDPIDNDVIDLPTDPTTYTTNWEYQGAWNMLRQVENPNGYIVDYEYGWDDADKFAYEKYFNIANRTAAHHYKSSVEQAQGPSAAYKTERWEFEPGFGNLGSNDNFVTQYTNGKGELVFTATFDANGNRKTVTYHDVGLFEEFDYHADGRLDWTKVTQTLVGAPDETFYTDFDYDANGYLNDVTQSKAAGQPTLTRTAYVNNGFGEPEKVRVYRDGGVFSETVIEYDLMGRSDYKDVPYGSFIGTAHDARTDFVYDGNGNVSDVYQDNKKETGAADPDNPVIHTKYTYDILNRKTREEVERTEGQYIATEWDYDQEGRVTEIRHPSGLIERIEYNSRGLQEAHRAYEFDETHLSTVLTQYTSSGLVKSVQTIDEVGTSEGRFTFNEYDDYDRLWKSHEREDVSGGTRHYYDELLYNELDQVTDRKRYADNGAVLQHLVYEYDLQGRVTKETLDLPDPAADIVTEYTYSGFENVHTVTDPANGVTTNVYDGAGRIAKSTDAKGNETLYEYNLMSKVTKLTIRAKSDVNGAFTEFVTHTIYDRQGNPEQVWENSESDKVLTKYNSRGLPVEITDRRGFTTTQVYDSVGHAVKTTREIDGLVVVAETEQLWDNRGLMTDQIDPTDNPTDYFYDDAGRLVTKTMADGQTWQYQYDGLGQATTTTTPGGNAVTITYDLFGRIKTESGPGGDYTKTFAYHELGGVKSEEILLAAGTIKTTRDFDERGLVTSETVTSPFWTGDKVTTLQYDALGNVTYVKYPGSRELSYLRDALGMVTTIHDGPDPLTDPEIAGYDYLGRSRVLRRTHGNDTQADYGFDSRGRMDLGKHSVTSTGAVFDWREYDWDKENNKTNRKRYDSAGLIVERERAFTYDGLGRMTTSTLTAGSVVFNDYGLDYAGNRTTVTLDGTPGAYTLVNLPPAQVHEYSSTPHEAFTRTYDNDGNWTGGGATLAIGYDTRNLMTSYADTGVTETYAYDAANRRIKRDDGTDTVISVYLGDRVIEEYDGTGTLLRSYVYGNYVDEVVQLRDEVGSEDYYYHADDQWNVVALTDSETVNDPAGTVVERYEYDDFGVPTVADASWAPVAGNTSAYANTRLFQGREYDTATGLYYYRARYYEPAAGRFTTRDPLGIWGDALHLGNGYAFLNHNPWSMIDPYGLEAGGNNPNSPETLNEALRLLERDLADRGAWLRVLDGYFLTLPREIFDLMVETVKAGGPHAMAVKQTLGLAMVGYALTTDFEGTAHELKSAFYSHISQAEFAGEAVFGLATIGIGGTALKGGKWADDLAKLGFIGKRKGICFVAGTLVETNEGLVPIEDVEVGDQVWAWHEDEDRVALFSVVQTFQRSSGLTFKIGIGDEEIETTSEHPFYVEGRGWTEAHQLEEGDVLRRLDNRVSQDQRTVFDDAPIVVDSIKVIPGRQDVYNFEVESAHTYFVSEHSILVHNKCFGDDDFLMGPTANGALRKFQEEGGGRTWSDFRGSPPDGDWVRYTTQLMEQQVRVGGQVRFDLTNVKDISGVLAGRGKFANKVTSGELRYIRNNWDRLQNHVTFYVDNNVVDAPW